MNSPFALLAAAGWFGSLRLLNRVARTLPSPLDTLIRWIHAMSFEGALIPLSLFLRPVGYFLFPKMRSKHRKGRPILLVHGYCHNCSAWLYLRRKLTQEGMGPIYVLNLVSPFRSIQTYAEKLHQKAEEIENETKRKDLTLIGHSMGGLVCSWYATHLASPGKVGDVITIGTPLQGTHIARVGFGPNAREMRRGSPFVQELQEAIANHPAIRFYHIGTKTDQLVVPSSSAWLGDNLERQFAVDDLGHLSLLFSSRVANKVCSWVKQS